MSCHVKLHVDIVCSFCERVAFQQDVPVELATTCLSTLECAVEQIRADGIALRDVAHGFIRMQAGNQSAGKVVCRKCLHEARKTWVKSQEIVRLFGEGKG
jgi:hypothetical protein